MSRRSASLVRAEVRAARAQAIVVLFAGLFIAGIVAVAVAMSGLSFSGLAFLQ